MPSIEAERPTSAPSAGVPFLRSLVRAAIWRRVRAVCSARCTAASSDWKGKGFTRKSSAPCFMASTAMSTVEWADIMSTVTSGWSASARCRVVSPSMPGRRTSSSMTSGALEPTRSRACSPDSAASTS
jgi:hypothetical protein